MPLLELRDLSFAYGRGAPAVDAVSLSVDAGEIVALVGPNGSGKSTLLRLASGMLPPDAGSVRLDGTVLAAHTRRDAARWIAGVAAEQAVEHAFTVRESAALGRHPWRSAFGPLSDVEQEIIDEALEATDLPHLADRPVAALSAGERQRVALARCLVQDARVMLLDEPTAHLDLGHGLRILDVLRTRAAARGVGVLAALHDLNLAALVADRPTTPAGGRIHAQRWSPFVLAEASLALVFGARVALHRHPERDVPVVTALGPSLPGDAS